MIKRLLLIRKAVLLVAFILLFVPCLVKAQRNIWNQTNYSKPLNNHQPLDTCELYTEGGLQRFYYEHVDTLGRNRSSDTLIFHFDHPSSNDLFVFEQIMNKMGVVSLKKENIFLHGDTTNFYLGKMKLNGNSFSYFKATVLKINETRQELGIGSCGGIGILH